MKVIYILLLLACTQTVSAQDYCKLIKKSVSADKTIFDFTSPFDQADLPAIRVSRSYNINPDNPTDDFYVIFQITGALDSIYTLTASGEQVERDETSLVIEFEDKTKITDAEIKVSHDVTDDKMQAIRYAYYPVTEEKLRDLSTKKISKFSLAGYSQTVPADSANAVMHYITCMKAVK